MIHRTRRTEIQYSGPVTASSAVSFLHPRRLMNRLIRVLFCALFLGPTALPGTAVSQHAVTYVGDNPYGVPTTVGPGGVVGRKK
jgi:hypothetical protein